MTTGLWDPEMFVENLRVIGARAYHDKHPFHVAMNEGRLSREALRGWVANRFYYQRNIPIKDAAILANCPVREVRRLWIHRILDHDGNAEKEGGIEAWLRLGEACGVSRTDLLEVRILQCAKQRKQCILLAGFRYCCHSTFVLRRLPFTGQSFTDHLS